MNRCAINAINSDDCDALKAWLNENPAFDQPLKLLLEAVQANHFACVETLLERFLPSLQSSELAKLVRFASNLEDERIVTLLLERGASFEPVAFSSALKKRKQTLVSMLVEIALRGKLVNVQTMLEIAVRNTSNDDGGMLRLVLDKCQPTWINAAACLAAARYGNCEAMRCFLSHGADVNTRDERTGRSLCHEAAMHGHADMLDLLLASGRDCNCDSLDNASVSPCILAAQHGRTDAVRRLLQAGAKVPKCEVAIAHWETFELLVASCADWKCEFATLCENAPRHSKVADFLLDAHELDNMWWYRLNLAISNDCDRVVSQIVADWGLPKPSENLAADAIKAGCANALRALVAAGANVNATVYVHNDFWRPLCFLAKGRVLAHMFALGADFNGNDRSRQAPVHYFARYDLSDEMLTAVAAGADLTTKDRHSALPADYVSYVPSRGLFAALDLLPPSVRPAVANGEVADALARLARRQFELMRLRGCEVCVGLQGLNLSALELCEIMSFAFSPLESLVPFHRVWAIATAAKHFRRN